MKHSLIATLVLSLALCTGALASQGNGSGRITAQETVLTTQEHRIIQTIPTTVTTISMETVLVALAPEEAAGMGVRVVKAEVPQEAILTLLLVHRLQA